MHTQIKKILSQNSSNSNIKKQELQEVFLEFWELRQVSTHFFINFLSAKVNSGVYIEDLTEASIYKCLSSITQRRLGNEKIRTA